MSPFATTRWSLILDARTGPASARRALDEIYRAYRGPVLAYVRRSGHADAEAEDLVQEFFARLIEKRWDTGADPARGRFRTYMLVALRRFLHDAGDAAHAAKRGGGQLRVDESALDTLASPHSPERAFERAWAITVIERAYAKLRAETDRNGRGALFEQLAPFLGETAGAAEYRELGEKLGLRANTIAVSVHRLRTRLRELVRDELADQVDGEENVAAELRVLRAALAADPADGGDARAAG
jgi:RNA polymerase sigma factor (sigma-70 family)